MATNHFTSNIISIVFLALLLLFIKTNNNQEKLTSIEVAKPILCGDYSINHYEIKYFRVDTIILGKENINISPKYLSGIISKLIHSTNQESGLALNIKSAKYEEYISLLDALIYNEIYKIQIENDWVYFFPNKMPRQIEEMQTYFLNSDNFTKSDMIN